MEIGTLNLHCGNCGVIEFCGNPFCYCLCSDMRFENIDEDVYAKIADKATGLRALEVCAGCVRGDCDVYRCSASDFADEPCEYFDESKDYFCKQIAGYVQSVLENNESGLALSYVSFIVGQVQL